MRDWLATQAERALMSPTGRFLAITAILFFALVTSGESLEDESE